MATVEDLVVKLCMQHVSPEDPNYARSKSEVLNQFDDELHMFMEKTGICGHRRAHIHDSKDITENRTYRWHAKFSKQTKYLGIVACRVTSKPLGQSASERQWSDCDRVASDKRGSLTSDRISKQSMLVGSYSMLKAEAKRQHQSKEVQFTESITDQDFLKVCITVLPPLISADDTKVHFNNSSKRSEKGYQVIGLHPGYDPKNVLSEDYDNWVIDQPSALWFDLRVLQVRPRPFHSCCNPAPVIQL